MIQNELRKGNIINRIDEFGGTHPGTITQIKATVAEYITPERRYDSAYFKYLSGVPLTPEILLKCGFENVIEFDYHFRKDEFDVMIESHGIYYYIDDRGDNEGTKPRQIKYLHQLQNLYFALTGIELTINL